jgi:hypothetical protein
MIGNARRHLSNGTASQKEKKLLDNLQKYYKSDFSLEYVAKAAHVPLRAVIEFMSKNKLPYYSDKVDTEEGLKKISVVSIDKAKKCPIAG